MSPIRRRCRSFVFPRLHAPQLHVIHPIRTAKRKELPRLDHVQVLSRTTFSWRLISTTSRTRGSRVELRCDRLVLKFTNVKSNLSYLLVGLVRSYG